MFPSYAFPKSTSTHCGAAELKFLESREVREMGAAVKKIKSVGQFLKNLLKFATIFENIRKSGRPRSIFREV